MAAAANTAVAVLPLQVGVFLAPVAALPAAAAATHGTGVAAVVRTAVGIVLALDRVFQELEERGFIDPIPPENVWWS